MASLPSTLVSPARPRMLRTRAPRAPSRHLVLVANGAASGVGRERLEAARRLLLGRGARLETRVTASVEELAEVTADADGRRLVLFGGDGTVHAAANLPGPRPELALLPAGRANNVANSLGIPVGLSAAAALAVDGAARAIDLIEASGAGRRRLAVEGVSVGFHAIARAGYHSPNSADVGAGFRAALAAARDFDGVNLRLEVDGSPQLARVGQLFAANLPLFAFGLRVAPLAVPDDGRLDLVALEATRRRSLVPMVLRLRRGTHVGREGTRSLTAKHVRIETCGNSPVIADTLNMGTGPVDLAVAPRALRLVAPR